MSLFQFQIAMESLNLFCVFVTVDSPADSVSS